LLRTLSLIFFLYFVGVPAWANASDWTKQRDIEKILDRKMRLDGIPGLSIAIVKNGQLWWSTGFGLADVGQGTQATSNTLYRAGSLVKPLTATAILQLMESGKIDADKPVWQYCKAYSEKKETVTVRKLLSHTSGVRTYNMPWSQYEKELFSKTRYKSVTDAISIFANDELAYPPGSRYLYSSYGYNLLGCVVESVMGSTFMEYLENKVLSPSRMENTIVDRAEEIVINRANHYRRDRKGRLINEQYVDMTNKIPSGGLLSTVNDIAKFAQNYMAGKLLSADSMKYARMPGTLSNSTNISYGAGWELPELLVEESSPEIFHSGLTPGATAIMYLYPEKQDAIIIMSNVYGVEGRVKLVNSIADIVQQ